MYACAIADVSLLYLIQVVELAHESPFRFAYLEF